MDVMDKKDSKIIEPLNKPRIKKHRFNIRQLRLSLKYRPEILKLVLKMRHCIREKNVLLNKLKYQIKCMEEERHETAHVVKDSSDVNNSEENLLLQKGKNVENEQVESKKNCTTQTDFLLIEKHFSDKNTSCEHITKNSYSQTEEFNVEADNKSTLLNVKQNISDKLCDKPTVNESELMPCIEKLNLKDKIVEVQAESSINNTYEEIRTNIASTQTEPCGNEDKVTRTIDIITENSDNLKSRLKHSCTQTDSNGDCNKVVEDKATEKKILDWTKTENGGEKSIAEQVKEVAQNAMQQSGMVYVESAGMYYDYKTGYYYNSELGLYYHTDTGCYYYYSNEQKTFVFHSYADRSAESQIKPEKPVRKAKKHKKTNRDEMENLTKNFSQDEDDAVPSKPKRKKTKRCVKTKQAYRNESEDKTVDSDKKQDKEDTKEKEELENKESSEVNSELEDGECSDSDNERSDSSVDESGLSTATASEDGK